MFLLRHQVHRDEEHTFGERLASRWVRKVPYLRADRLIQLRVDHHLLHLGVGQLTRFFFIEHVQVISVLLLVLGLQVPDRVLLFVG